MSSKPENEPSSLTGGRLVNMSPRNGGGIEGALALKGANDFDSSPLFVKQSDDTQERVGKVIEFPRAHDHDSPSLRVAWKNPSEVSPDKAKNGHLRALASTPARLGPSISSRKFEKQHGLRESEAGRFVRKNVQKPLGKAALSVGDFGVKSIGESYLDRIDVYLKFEISDINNNYTRGVLPKVIREPLGLILPPGMANALSLSLEKLPLIGKINSYRRARRMRINRMKEIIKRPSRSRAKKISYTLPMYEKRHKMAQKVSGVLSSFDEKYSKIKSFINGGIRGWINKRKRKRASKEQKAQKQKNIQMKPRKNLSSDYSKAA